MANKLLSLEIISPAKIIFNGQVQYLSSTNAVGDFDILPEHIPFVCLIQNFIKIKLTNNTVKTVPINEAILHCRDNKITIFTDFEKVSLSG